MPIGNNGKSVSFTYGSHHGKKTLCVTALNLTTFIVGLM